MSYYSNPEAEDRAAREAFQTIGHDIRETSPYTDSADLTVCADCGRTMTAGTGYTCGWTERCNDCHADHAHACLSCQD